jgi:hypothetical protein
VLETADAFGLRVQPRVGVIRRSPLALTSIPTIRWLPLTYAVNSLTRSMGQPDLYPFVLAPTLIRKLRLVHGLSRALHSEKTSPKDDQSGLYVRAPRTHRLKACIRAGRRKGRRASSASVTSAGASDSWAAMGRKSSR